MQLIPTSGSAITIPAFADHQSAADWLRTEVAACDRTERDLVLQFLRIGIAIVMMRDHAPRGTLTKVYQLSQLSAKQLQRYATAADYCLQKLGLKDKTGKLAVKALPAAGDLLLVQPDLFDDHKAIAENQLLSQMATLIAGRTLNRFLADLSPKSSPPAGSGHDPDAPPLTPEEIRRQACLNAIDGLKKQIASGSHLDLLTSDRHALEAWLEQTWRDLSAHNKSRSKKLKPLASHL